MRDARSKATCATLILPLPGYDILVYPPLRILSSFSTWNQNHLIHEQLFTILMYLYFSVGTQSLTIHMLLKSLLWKRLSFFFFPNGPLQFKCFINTYWAVLTTFLRGNRLLSTTLRAPSSTDKDQKRIATLGDQLDILRTEFSDYRVLNATSHVQEHMPCPVFHCSFNVDFFT